METTILEKKESFLPETYKVPDKAKQFMKLEVGDNLIRILSAPLLGWVFFNEENKPVRRSFDDGEYTLEELQHYKAKRNEKGEIQPSRHFWIMLVWDFKANAPKILEISQLSIIKYLCGVIDDEAWGDLRNFEINIKRQGAGKNDSKYEVLPKPPKPLAEEIELAILELEESKLIDLNAIWKGEYPFQIYNW